LNENQGTKEYKILDWIILSLFVIFILSLSNSIFVNQVGYFGALLFILIKTFLTKKNQFNRTGLELAFALYLIAEIVSLIFSDYKDVALHHFMKRSLLIPVVYTTIAVTTNLKRGKNFFTLFVVGSLVTGVLYLIMSIQFYLNNQYSIVQSGPSLFQNTITASEIISFTVLFLFAFIVNEKTDLKTKLLLYSGFAISLLTLIATYKRTGWMGVAAGIILILIIKGKWKILIPVFILGIVLFFIDKNVSQVSVYNFEGSSAKKLYSFNTEGRATSVEVADSFSVISDYENGLLFYQDSVLFQKVETPVSVALFKKIKDDYFLAYLVDTRILIYKRESRELKQISEILPPGETKDFVLLGESLYTLDKDSGMTFYQSVFDESKPIRFPEIKGYKWMFIDSSNFYFAGEQSGISVFERKEFLPGNLIAKNEISDINRAHFFKGNLVVSGSYGLRMFSLENNKIVQKDQLTGLKQVNRFSSDEDVLAILSGDGSIYKYKVNDNYKLELLAQTKVSPNPTNFNITEGKLYCAYVKRGRMLSFFDPHLPQNFTRLALWRAGWEMFKDHPLFGVGDIGLDKYYVKYKRPYDKEIHGHLHNNYFHFLATLGLFGFLALSYLFIMIIIRIFKIYKSNKETPFIASYSLGALASFVSILVAGLSEVNFWDHEIATLIYFTVGLSIALSIRRSEEVKKG
jgi:O-antigen ligase